MNTDFITTRHQLELRRFPEEHDPTLQAWDAADEYLLEHLAEGNADYSRVLILNDSFGALGCALASHRPTLMSDSFISEQAYRLNLERNGLGAGSFEFINSLQEWQARPSLVLLKIPRSHDYLGWQLARLSQLVKPDTQVIAAAKARDIHTSTLSLFERYLGRCHTSLARKKARLVFCEPSGRPSAPPPPTCWTVPEQKLSLCNHANVFSAQSLDIGARLFVQHLPADRQGPIVDLGCGNGVVGIVAARHNPRAEIWFVDESYMAIESARQNVQANAIANDCRFMVNNCLDGVDAGSAEVVLCNPPFHQQQAVTDHIATQMFRDAKRVLRRGGELRIVGNRHLGYHWRLQRLFGNCRQLASNPKFVVLAAIKQ